jgi:hypothetical protein
MEADNICKNQSQIGTQQPLLLADLGASHVQTPSDLLHSGTENSEVERKRKRAREYARKFRSLTRETRLVRARELYQNNRLKILAKQKEYRLQNPQRRKEINQKAKAKEKEKVKAGLKPWLLVARRMRNQLRKFVQRRNASRVPREEMMGCTREVFLAHLESLFLPGMTWANHALWHIDHIRPCASFDLSDPAQVKQCFHFSNLRPLWARDNIAKGAKWKQAA